jgi:hypothetical protein
MKPWALRALLACAALSAACSSNSATAPSTTTTETFTGTVAVGGSDSHNFTVNNEGEVDVTLTAAAPPPDIVMGLALGTPSSGSACTPLSGASVQAGAGTGAQLTGVVTPGVLCVQVSDVGRATAPVSYTVTVKHP